jgi:hypothetical protein
MAQGVGLHWQIVAVISISGRGARGIGKLARKGGFEGVLRLKTPEQRAPLTFCKNVSPRPPHGGGFCGGLSY